MVIGRGYRMLALEDFVDEARGGRRRVHDHGRCRRRGAGADVLGGRHTLNAFDPNALGRKPGIVQRLDRAIAIRRLAVAGNPP